MIKEFDCVEMKRKGANKMRRELAELDATGKLNYWKEAYEELVERQQFIQRREAKFDKPSKKSRNEIAYCSGIDRREVKK